jgi:hypothetical protein
MGMVRCLDGEQGMARRSKNTSARRPARRLSTQQAIFIVLSILIVASFVLSMLAR